MKKYYRLTDAVTSAVIAEGTVDQLAARVGCCEKTIRDAAKNGTKIHLYGKVKEIEKRANGTAEPVLSMAEQWDRFCEPIRKKYGIPVKHPTRGGRKP